MKQPKTEHNDSSEVCHISLSGRRKHTSFRCDEKLWSEFKRICRKNGLSTCDILEKLIMGFCIGITQPRVAQPTTINVVVDAPRVVKRVRRRQLIFEDEVSEDVVNIARRLELKLVKQDLTAIINGLEQKRGDQSFLLGRLREVLPKAVRLYQKTSNAEIAVLLEKAEKYI